MKLKTIIFLAVFQIINASQASAGLKVSCSMFPHPHHFEEYYAEYASIYLKKKDLEDMET